MNITIGYNCWSNYDDVLLGSEIIRELNKENIFENLHIISHSGYHTAPNQNQMKYLDRFIKINTKLDDLQNLNVNKVLAPARIFEGYKIAYEYALKSNCEFAIVTNGDSWFFNLKKLKKLLNLNQLKNCCISSRVGNYKFLNSEYGSQGKFFDDHFFIINVNNCLKYNVFDFSSYEMDDPIYLGGIDYQISRFLNVKVPSNKHFVYSDMSECRNHYNIRCNSNLIPYTYDPKYEMLHANIVVDKYLNYLRSKILEYKNLNHMSETAKYIKKYNSKNFKFIFKNNFVYFKKPIVLEIKIILYVLLRRIFYYFVRIFFINKKNKLLSFYLKQYDPYKDYKKYIKIPPAQFSQIRKIF